MRRLAVRVGLVSVLLVIGVSCAVAPPVHRLGVHEDDEHAQHIPRSDFDLGLRITMEVGEHIGFVDVDSLRRRVNDIGYRVASMVPRPALFTFHVIDMPDPNAFALPGGFIFVTRGMMELNLTDGELAALLGHEVGHVIHNHFSRSQRLSSVLSLAQLALLVGVFLAADDVAASGPRYEVMGDQVTRGSTGRDALIEGVPLFGGLFRTLLERKYGRGLEYEADETGVRLSTKVGYPSGSTADLLDKLRERVHEDATYGFWLTHPFFKERAPRAAAQGRSIQPATEPPPVYAFRRAVQAELFRIASLRDEDDEASFLYEMALRAEPRGMTALEAGHELLRFRTSRDVTRRELERELWPIIADYDSLITRARRIDPNGELAEAMSVERDSLDRDRGRIRERYGEEFEKELQATSVLEGFIVNFPDDPQFPGVLYLLSENYRRSGRWELAAKSSLRLRRDHPEEPWPAKAESTLSAVVPRLKDPCVMQSVLESPIPDVLMAEASAQMDSLIVSLESMEEPAAFLERYPASSYADPMRRRLEEQAGKAYLEAKLLEGVGRSQRALDAYHRILFLAPDSDAAAQARERIDFLVRSG